MTIFHTKFADPWGRRGWSRSKPSKWWLVGVWGCGIGSWASAPSPPPFCLELDFGVPLIREHIFGRFNGPPVCPILGQGCEKIYYLLCFWRVCSKYRQKPYVFNTFSPPDPPLEPPSAGSALETVSECFGDHLGDRFGAVWRLQSKANM